jgi:hypothetical protein
MGPRHAAREVCKRPRTFLVRSHYSSNRRDLGDTNRATPIEGGLCGPPLRTKPDGSTYESTL